MSIPQLNRRLSLQDVQRTPDGAGGYTQTWVTLGTIWAQVRAITGRETGVNHLVHSTIQYEITLRNAPSGAPSRPKPEQRFSENGRIYRIVAVVENDPTGRYLTCTAIEEVAV